MRNTFSASEIKVVQMYGNVRNFYEKENLRLLETKELSNMKESKVAVPEMKFVAEMIKPSCKQADDGKNII